MRTTPLILALTLALGACGRPETDDTGCVDCTDTDTSDTSCCTADIDDDGDGLTEAEGDCDDTQPAINPMATDLVGDGIDQNCDDVDGTDGDSDGHPSTVSGCDDCDDTDLYTFPGAIEIWYDGIDQGCIGGGWLGDSDQDGDGFDADGLEGGTDCTDVDPTVNPQSIEINGDTKDNNCNGQTDEWTFHIEWNPNFECPSPLDPFDPASGCVDSVVFSVSATDQTYVPEMSGNAIELFAKDAMTAATGDILLPLNADGTVRDLVPEPAPALVTVGNSWTVTAPTATLTWKLLFRNIDTCILWGDERGFAEFDPEGICLRYDPTTP